MTAEHHATLLIVEDDAGLARLQKTRLERAGHIVICATNADEGRARATAGGIDLLVLDQRLPGAVSGLEFYRQIKAAGHDVPTILVTAFSDEQVVLQALRAGVIDFIPKTPNFLDYLVPAVDRILKERRVERQLAESRSELAGIIDSALDALLSVGADGKVLVFNPAAENIFRCPAAAARGQPVTRFLPRWDDLLRGVPAEGRQVRHAETEGHRDNDGTFPLEISLSRTPQLTFWTCIARDLTDRRKAEEEHRRLLLEKAARAEAERAEGRLRQLVAQLQEQAHLLEMAHVLVRDPHDRVIFWNKGTTQMYGWSAEEALGQNSHELLRTIFPVPHEQVRAELEKHGQWEGELIHSRKDGSSLVVASHWALHRDGDGKPVAILEVNNDVTELKRLQEALRVSDQRKDEFLATLAHELRNPLAPILNALHIMRLAKNNASSVENGRGIIERQVKHMVRLIDDLLDLSRITRGKIQLRMQAVELATVVQTAVESSRPAIDAAGHRLSVTLPKKPILFEADPLRLAQVLTNLLNNAAKYTEPGGQIRLVVRHEGDELAMVVSDTGVGIPPDMLPTIFEMFAQIDRSLDRSQGGLGIGLSLVRGLVRLHGGMVSARSEGPGKGSEFIVRLPLRRVERDQSVALTTVPRPVPSAARRRVLVVDDNVDGARSLETLLEMLGHQVALAHDGFSALEEARLFRPDVVLLDIGLPGLSGYDVARMLRKQSGNRDVLLVAMTGWGKEDDRRKSVEAGFNAHLVKPVELSDLENLLADVPV